MEINVIGDKNAKKRHLIFKKKFNSTYNIYWKESSILFTIFAYHSFLGNYIQLHHILIPLQAKRNMKRTQGMYIS